MMKLSPQIRNLSYVAGNFMDILLVFSTQNNSIDES